MKWGLCTMSQDASLVSKGSWPQGLVLHEGAGQAQGKPRVQRPRGPATRQLSPMGWGRGMTPGTGEAEMGQEGKGGRGTCEGLGAGAGGSRTALPRKPPPRVLVKARHNRKRGPPGGTLVPQPQIPWRKEQIHWKSRQKGPRQPSALKYAVYFFSPIIKIIHYPNS